MLVHVPRLLDSATEEVRSGAFPRPPGVGTTCGGQFTQPRLAVAFLRHSTTAEYSYTNKATSVAYLGRHPSPSPTTNAPEDARWNRPFVRSSTPASRRASSAPGTTRKRASTRRRFAFWTTAASLTCLRSSTTGWRATPPSSSVRSTCRLGPSRATPSCPTSSPTPPASAQSRWTGPDSLAPTPARRCEVLRLRAWRPSDA